MSENDGLPRHSVLVQCERAKINAIKKVKGKAETLSAGLGGSWRVLGLLDLAGLGIAIRPFRLSLFS